MPRYLNVRVKNLVPLLYIYYILNDGSVSLDLQNPYYRWGIEWKEKHSDRNEIDSDRNEINSDRNETDSDRNETELKRIESGPDTSILV